MEQRVDSNVDRVTGLVLCMWTFKCFMKPLPKFFISQLSAQAYCLSISLFAFLGRCLYLLAQLFVQLESDEGTRNWKFHDLLWLFIVRYRMSHFFFRL